MLRVLVFLIIFCFAQVKSFATPFSEYWTVTKTFGGGGFEGQVRVPVQSSVTRGWKITLTFDKPVKGFKIWRGVVDDVSPDFTVYDIINQPWNTYLHENSEFEFNILGYSQKGLPSLKITFQDEVYGEIEDISESGSGSGGSGDSELWVDYDQVISLSLQFFEAKRSGRMSRDNRIKWKLDSALYDGGAEGFNLIGGYYVGGDYVKFGFPMAFAMTQLAWGALESRRGYEHAGEMGTLLKTIRWGTDYFIKAHVDDNVLFGMVGDPGIDHGQWESGASINWRRPAYRLTKDDPGSDLAAETAAALASAAILFVAVEDSYVEVLINHAQFLYDFADQNRGRYDVFSIPGAKDYYPSSDYGDELVWAALWLYRATEQERYLNEAIDKFDEFRLGRQSLERGFDYDNKILGVMILLNELTGDYDKYMPPVLDFCDKWSKGNRLTSDGLLHNSRVKSAISFSANTAFVCAIAAKHVVNDNIAMRYRALAETIIAEILGKGSSIGYMVGFGDHYPSTLHDRESSCPTPPKQCGWNFFNSPTPNAHLLVGALMGGPDKYGQLDDTRKNFVGNQPNILYNSAFQSLVAAMNSHHIRLNRLTVIRMTAEELRSEVFTGEDLSRFDACSSFPCENDGSCTNAEGFGYNCECPVNVFGRNCEFRMVPSIKWINKWNTGAQIHLELPDNRPPKEWQLRMRFPIGCPLKEIDVWNACLNVLESSREQEELFLQLLDWQKHMNFIGIKFELESKLEHCFHDDKYHFQIFERGATSLVNRNPDNCPRKLPHAYEGSGSGFSGDDYFDTPPEGNTNVVLTPAPGSTSHPPPTTLPPLKVVVGPPNMLEWVSRWPYGGQGHIHVQNIRPNNEGDWELKVKFPSKCPLKGIKFWSACVADSVSLPEEGVFILEQIDWQIHQSFIGFAVHFSAGAVDSAVCYDRTLYEFVFTEIRLAHNINVNYCTAEFQDIKSHNPFASKSVIDDKQPLFLEDTEAVMPPPRLRPDRYVVVPDVEDLKAHILPDSSMEITWKQPGEDAAQVEITLEPTAAGDVTYALDDEFVKAYTKHNIIESSSTSHVFDDVTPGMKYQLTVNFLGSNKKSGPSSSLYITPKPKDVQNIRSVSLDGSSVLVTWNQPIGMHDSFRVIYVPESNTGTPRSPFDVTGNASSFTISNLSTDRDFIVAISTKSGGASSDGVHIHAKTVLNRCSEITCSDENEVCETETTGPRCICKIGFKRDTICTDIDECVDQQSNVCHEKAFCQNTLGSYSCHCSPGYTGDGIFCYDLNECEHGLANCSGRCVNTVGSYMCACPEGYTGKLENCLDIDECSSDPSICSDDTVCVNSVGSYSCVCHTGFAVVDDKCEDVDECVLNTFNCTTHTNCINSYGSYECRCQKGFVMKNDACEDINECDLSVHSCHDFATCHNLIGGYLCACIDGYQGDGMTCTDVNECSDPNACSPHATCENTAGSYTCRCLAGYTGNGIICQDLLG